MRRFLRLYVAFSDWLWDDAGWMILILSVAVLCAAAFFIGGFPFNENPSFELWVRGWKRVAIIAPTGFALWWLSTRSRQWAKSYLAKEPTKPLRDYLYEQAKRELDEMFPADKE